MNKIEFVKDKIPFTQVANGVLNDKRLSAKAKGLYAYLYSKPDGWDFAIDRIALDMTDGRKSINEGLKELEVLGFLTRKRQSDGRVLYVVHFPPIEPNAQNGHEVNIEPNAQKAIVPKSHMTKMGTVSNKELLVIKNISNKDIAKQALQELPKEISEVIKEFEAVNKACSDYYGNVTQRKAVEKLINAYGYEFVVNVIRMLPKMNRVLYNKATTPVELWNKWAKIEAEASKLKETKNSQKYAITKTY